MRPGANGQIALESFTTGDNRELVPREPTPRRGESDLNDKKQYEVPKGRIHPMVFGNMFGYTAATTAMATDS